MKIELTKAEIQAALMHMGNSYGDGSYYFGRTEKEDRMEEKKLKSAFKKMAKAIGKQNIEI